MLKTWKDIREIINIYNKVARKTNYYSIRNASIAETFNNYFSTVGTRGQEKLLGTQTPFGDYFRECTRRKFE